MDEKFIGKRITALRIAKDVSEYKMSLDLGHSKNYIRNITVKNSLPSMREFLYLCEYLGVTPKQFFDVESDYDDSVLVNQLLELIPKLSKSDIELLIKMSEKMIKQ